MHEESTKTQSMQMESTLTRLMTRLIQELIHTEPTPMHAESTKTQTESTLTG